jgi:small ligand-binding sensory domain FIST
VRWCSAVSESSTLDSAISECGEAIRAEIGPLAVDLVVAFVSQHHASGFDRVPELVRQEFPQGAIVGCSAGGVIGAGREVEHRPGLAIAAAHLPDVDVAPFRVETSDMPDADAPPDRWEELVHVSGHREAHFVLLVDPFSFDAEQFVMGLDFAFPPSSKIGGMASGGQRPGGNALFLTDEVYRSGAVGVALSGNVTVDTIVAQGCRPIGRPMQVTSVNRNVLTGLDDEKPIEVLQRIYSGLPASDQLLARQAVFLGIAMDPMNETPQLGDFLVRTIVGGDHATGAISVAEMLREGQTVQFHVRDAATSAQDLDHMLTSYSAQSPIYEETGALLFSCLGRGEYLYGQPDHDTQMFRDKVSPMPLTGFFCNGEIGPVGGSTFLHSYTSSFGIFRPKL